MKKLFFAAAAAMAILFTSCKEDPIEEPAVQFSLEATSAMNSGRASSVEIDAKVKFRNLENKVIIIKWQRYDVNVPSTWQVATCDNEQCRVPAVTEYTMTIPANDSFDMKAVFYPNAEVGTGTARIRVFDPADSARTVQSILYTVDAS
jgi:hypothetical protein